MGIELITGMGGTNHVDSEDVGALNAELIGNGNYLLSGCEVTMTDANTCHVAAGELLLQGRHVRIKGAGEDVSIGNGQAGYNQRYLICLVYSKATSGIETVGLQAFAGAKTTGAATDPAVAVGSILGGDTNVVVPLARLELTGLSVGTPAVMLDSVKGLVALGAETKKLGDSVSPKRFSPTIINLSGGEFNFFKIGKLAVCNFNGVKLAISVPVRYGVNISRDMPKPPAGYEARGTVSIMMSDPAKIATLSIAVGSDGVMSVVNTGNATVAAGDVFYGSLIYALA